MTCHLKTIITAERRAYEPPSRECTGENTLVSGLSMYPAQGYLRASPGYMFGPYFADTLAIRMNVVRTIFLGFFGSSALALVPGDSSKGPALRGSKISLTISRVCFRWDQSEVCSPRKERRQIMSLGRYELCGKVMCHRATANLSEVMSRRRRDETGAKPKNPRWKLAMAHDGLGSGPRA
jgi:hypothetical protein